jgi:dTMP kinase
MRYFALEGIDNCGKSTLIKLLKKDFPNFNYVREPGTTKYAEELRSLMFSHLEVNPVAIQLAMTSARVDLATNLLNQNKDTISDRCFLSLAYVDGFDIQTIDNILLTNKNLVPKLPDLIIYLYVSAEESVKRFYDKKMEGYDTLSIDSINKRLLRYEYLINKVEKLDISKVVKVNAERNVSEVYDEVRRIINGEYRTSDSTC